MSAGNFVTSAIQFIYNSAVNVHPIRVQPETLGLVIEVNGVLEVNSVVTLADVTNPIAAYVSGSRKTPGLIPGKVRIRFTGTPPAGYAPGSVLQLPVLNLVILQSPRGATGTYLGEPIEVVGTTPAYVN